MAHEHLRALVVKGVGVTLGQYNISRNTFCVTVSSEIK